MKNTSRHKAIGPGVSPQQQLIEQLTAKRAIMQSPEILRQNLYDIKNLPPEVLTAVHEAGLYDKLMTCPPATLHIDSNVTERVIRWINRYGKHNGNEVRMEKMTLKFKTK